MELHPLISFDLIKKIPNLIFCQKYFDFKKFLAEDLVSAKALLYRGSTVTITAGANGVTNLHQTKK